MAIVIPEKDHARFSALLSLDAKSLDALYSALERAEPHLDRRAFIAKVSDQAPTDPKVIADAVTLLLTLFQVRYARGWSPEEAADEFVQAAQGAGVAGLSNASAGWEGFKGKLARLLSLDRPVGVTAKAALVRNETPRHLHRVQILTDARPIFASDVKSNPSAFVIMHVLELEYHEDEESRSWFVSVDADDFESLEAAIRRAKMKERSLRRVLRATKVPLFDWEVSE